MGITKQFKKSEIEAKTEYDFYLITRKSSVLLDCEIMEKKDEDIIEFSFENVPTKDLSEYRKASLEEKYQVLINIATLEEEAKRLNLHLAPENIYCTANFSPMVMIRDVYGEAVYSLDSFTNSYKALIGYLLNKNLEYENFAKGGKSLLNKSKITEPYTDLSTTSEIKDMLISEYEKYEDNIRKTVIQVNKKKNAIERIIGRVSIVVAVLLLVFSGYVYFYNYRHLVTINTANESYINQDYVKTIEILSKVEMKRLAKNSKYIYATSYVKTEALDSEKKNNVLASITLNSDERILDFWILLSRSKMVEAIDIAKQLGNDEYALYGNMKYLSYVENSNSYSGEQKASLIESLKKIIADLNAKLYPESGN